jgi:hypothetical protein
VCGHVRSWRHWRHERSERVFCRHSDACAGEKEKEKQKHNQEVYADAVSSSEVEVFAKTDCDASQDTVAIAYAEAFHSNSHPAGVAGDFTDSFRNS